MSIDITMPRLSDTMESGTIIKWNVKEGDTVSAGDSVADVETDKATMEMQVFDDGTIAKILINEGRMVDVGTTLAVMAGEGEDPDSVASESGEAEKSQQSSESGESGKSQSQEKSEERQEQSPQEQDKAGAVEKQRKQKQQQPVAATAAAEGGANGEEKKSERKARASGDGKIRISPVARRLAEDNDIDLGQLAGSGPSGRIIKRDVLEAVESGRGGQPQAAFAGESKLEARTIEMTGMRQTIAKRLVESKTTIPHYQVTVAIDMDELHDLRETLNRQLENQNVKLSVNDFLVRACGLAMHEHQEFNASWDQSAINVHGDVNIGIAISLPRERGGGLVVGAIQNTDRKGLRQISSETKSLAEKARGKGLSLEEMSDATFVVSNLGMYGVEHFTAIINPPNSAILAVGAATQKPVVRDGEIVIGREMSATLSLDHRVIDGAMAAKYLQTLKSLLENPAGLLV